MFHLSPLSLYPQIEHLTEGTFYEFKVQAANLAGVGLASTPSAPMKCEAWHMQEPGKRTIRVSSPGFTESQIHQNTYFFSNKCVTRLYGVPKRVNYHIFQRIANY